MAAILYVDTTLNVVEIVSDGVQRLYFGNDLSNNQWAMNFFFTNTNVQACVDINVFVKVRNTMNANSVCTSNVHGFCCFVMLYSQ